MPSRHCLSTCRYALSGAAGRLPFLYGKSNAILLAMCTLPGTQRIVEASLTDAEAWSVQIGVFANREIAIAELASAALSDISGLRSAGREVEQTQLRSGSYFRARLTGLEADKAKSACKALKNRGKDCLAVAPR